MDNRIRRWRRTKIKFQWYIQGSIDSLVVDPNWSCIMADRSLAASAAWLGSLSLSRFSFHRHGRWLKLVVLPAPAIVPLLYQPAAAPHLPTPPSSQLRCRQAPSPVPHPPPAPVRVVRRPRAVASRAELTAAAAAGAAPPLPPSQCLATPRMHHRNPSCQAHRCQRAAALLASSP
jgi:hypothetical protein